MSIVTAGNNLITAHGNAALKRLEPIAGKDGVALDNYISLVHVSLLRYLWLQRGRTARVGTRLGA